MYPTHTTERRQVLDAASGKSQEKVKKYNITTSRLNFSGWKYNGIASPLKSPVQPDSWIPAAGLSFAPCCVMPVRP